MHPFAHQSRLIPALATCFAFLQCAATDVFAGHYHMEDSEMLSTNAPTYRLEFRYYDPNTPPGDEPAVIPIPNTPTPNYFVTATGDPGIWIHGISCDFSRTNGQQYSGFTVMRQKLVGGQWVDDVEITATWVP